MVKYMLYAIESCSRCAIAHPWVCPTNLAHWYHSSLSTISSAEKNRPIVKT